MHDASLAIRSRNNVQQCSMFNQPITITIESSLSDSGWTKVTNKPYSVTNLRIQDQFPVHSNKSIIPLKTIVCDIGM